jgi:integrase
MQGERYAAATGDGPTAKSKRDVRKLVPTKTPGIYKRGGSYVVVYRAGGKQRKEFARTFDGARAIKRAREADRDRGEFQARSKVALRDYLSWWVDSYQGTGRRGFRENTRGEYRRLLDSYAHRFFGERLRLTDVTPLHLSDFVRWVADPSKQDGKRLSDSSIANAVVPVRAALATAKREGLIRHNPADGLALPARERVEDDDHEEVKALSRTQLDALLSLTPKRYALLVELIASTGLRISEAIGLQRRHLQLDGTKPQLRVRRAIVRGRVEPPKSRHGRRNVPLPQALVFKLRAHLAAQTDESAEALVFASRNGTPLDPDNMRARMLKPLMEEVAAPWAAWHSLRHTYASLQLARGVNVVQLSRALGHHSASFTLDVYVHLLEGEEAPPLDLARERVTAHPERLSVVGGAPDPATG